MNMRQKIGAVLMTTGVLLVCGALGLFIFNQWQNARAGDSVELILPQLVENIEDTEKDDDSAVYSSEEMTEVMIDGYAYVGYLSIPALDLDLPVMSEWDYTRLKISPCRYSGSTNTDDMVICAHNYIRHFASIKRLSVNDKVTFTDMDGVKTQYTVVSVETLEPTAVKDMTDSGYDLTLFTCTYGNTARVTVRCNRS